MRRDSRASLLTRCIGVTVLLASLCGINQIWLESTRPISTARKKTRCCWREADRYGKPWPTIDGPASELNWAVLSRILRELRRAADNALPVAVIILEQVGETEHTRCQLRWPRA
jgi:hypothetical protein